MATMKAAQIKKLGEKYTLCDIPKPEPGRGQLLIRVGAAGFCHTDMLTARGTFGDQCPITGSHEPAGVVEALGEGVTGFAIGDRVISLNKASQCGECWDCRKLDAAFCPNGKLAGLHTDGCFAEYFTALAAVTVKIPDDLSFEKAAPMTCAGITIFEAIRKAVREGGLEKGRGVLAISGLGALGHIGVQMAKAMGYFVVGIDARQGPLDLCASFRLAPDVLIDASKTSAEEAAKQINKAWTAQGLGDERPLGVDAIVMTAESDAAITYGFDLVRRHGTYVLLSQPDVLHIPFHYIIFKNVKLVGSLQGNRQDLQDAVDLVAKEDIVVQTKAWKLDDVNKAWEATESPRQVGKNVIVFD